MPITATSHAFAAGDIDYINNLNLVRTDIGSLITDANTNPKGTMAAQNANAVAITGGSVSGVSSVGVGTSSPLSDLDIYGGFGDGSSFDSVLTLSRTSSTGNVLACKWVLDDKSVNYGNMVLRIKTTVSGSESSAYYTDALCVDGQNGYLGLGTLSPSTMLHISKQDSNNFIASTTAITLQNSQSASSDRGAVLKFTHDNRGNNFVAYIGSGLLTSTATGATGYLSFGVKTTEAAALPTEVIRVLPSLNTLIGTTTDNGVDRLQVNGTASATSPAGGANNTQLATTSWVVAKGYLDGSGAIRSTSPTAGVGYATGAGGAVTQTGSITTAVTLNKICGRITTVADTIAGGSSFTFTMNNSTIGQFDNVIVNITPDGTSAFGDIIIAYCAKVNNGSCTIRLKNEFGSASPVGTYVLNFSVIKSVNS